MRVSAIVAPPGGHPAGEQILHTVAGGLERREVSENRRIVLRLTQSKPVGGYVWARKSRVRGSARVITVELGYLQPFPHLSASGA